MAARNTLLSRLRGMMGTPVPSVGPYTEAGVSGTAVVGGYVITKERSSKLFGQERYRTASDIMSNISIVAAGLRYFLNLVAKPKWSVEPADDSDEAKELAEFVEEVMDSMDTAWSRVIRRAGLYRYHGFGVHEWTAKRRDDGRIGLQDIEPRPQHTIERWDVDQHGTVKGVWQRSPQTGEQIGLPRSKIIYLVDDTLTDSPEGMGWFRHLVPPSEKIKTYLQLEGQGFQRDLSGTPVGKAPIALLDEMVKKGAITPEAKEEALHGLEAFIRLKAKEPGTSIMLDSSVYKSQTADGFQQSAAPLWAVDLLTGQITSIEYIGNAIIRLTEDMARIIGCENLLLGSDGKGSLALSKDKSNNMYLQVDSTLADMSAQFSKDVVDPLWKLNGFPDDLKPRLKTEAVAFKDVEQITAALRDLATAGAPLAPDDPAINDVRDLMGISHAPELNPAQLGVMGIDPVTGKPISPQAQAGIDPKTGQPFPKPAPGEEGEAAAEDGTTPRSGDEPKPNGAKKPQTVHKQTVIVLKEFDDE